MSDSECTTDAMPSPPRTRKEKVNVEKETDIPGEKNKTENINKEDEIPPLKYANGPVVNYIHINNSPQTHVGNTIYYNSFSKPPEPEPELIKETEKIAAMKQSTTPVIDKDIDAIKLYIGRGWKETFRQLGFKSPYIEQIESETRFRNDTNGLIRHLLVDWRQANGKSLATVGKLSQALWNSNQHIALQYWSIKYDDLHK